MQRHRILVTGSNGLIGQKLVQQLAADQNHEVLAISRNPSLLVPSNFTFQQLDVSDFHALGMFVMEFRPNTIVNTAAMAQPNECEANQAECWKVNVRSVEELYTAANEVGAHFIQFSTDFVFDGVGAPYRETDLPNPQSYYGMSKQVTEEYLSRSQGNWAVIRTIQVYGVAPQLSRPNLLHWVKGSLEKNQPIRVVNDQFRMPTLAEDLVGACVEMIRIKAQGIFHISGAESMSIFEMALQIADSFGLDASLITPVSSTALNELAKRPANTGFVLEKAQAELNYSPQTFAAGLAFIKNQLKGFKDGV